jgi:hypothetical protein
MFKKLETLRKRNRSLTEAPPRLPSGSGDYQTACQVSRFSPRIALRSALEIVSTEYGF